MNNNQTRERRKRKRSNVDDGAKSGGNPRKKQKLMAVNKGSSWSLFEDRTLWHNRDLDVMSLAEHFGRTESSIRYRLENLRDPNHKSYVRLATYNNELHGKRIISCNQYHGQSGSVDIELLLSSKYDASKSNKGKKWRLQDDRCIYENRDCSVDLLASHHYRTNGAIRARLDALLDSNHSAYQRFHKYKGMKINNNKSNNSDKILIEEQQKEINKLKIQLQKEKTRRKHRYR